MEVWLCFSLRGPTNPVSPGAFPLRGKIRAANAACQVQVSRGRAFAPSGEAYPTLKSSDAARFCLSDLARPSSFSLESWQFFTSFLPGFTTNSGCQIAESMNPLRQSQE